MTCPADADDLLPEFRWPVAVEKAIPVASARLWQTISTAGNLANCHPYCRANPVHSWPGVASRDEIRYLNGLVFERRILRWFDGIGYDLEIGRRGGAISTVSWRVRPVDEHHAALFIKVYPNLLQTLPGVLRWLPFKLRVQPLLARYLAAVTSGYDWYLTRGEPVPRDQFGRHPWFSAS